MITTQFSGGFGNMVVKTKKFRRMAGVIQSNYNLEGINPSLFFDDNGKAYVVHNDAPAQGEERYSGHRVIKIWDYDVETGRELVREQNRIIVNGGVNIEEKPIWIEAPHIYKKDGNSCII